MVRPTAAHFRATSWKPTRLPANDHGGGSPATGEGGAKGVGVGWRLHRADPRGQTRIATHHQQTFEGLPAGQCSAWIVGCAAARPDFRARHRIDLRLHPPRRHRAAEIWNKPARPASRHQEGYASSLEDAKRDRRWLCWRIARPRFPAGIPSMNPMLQHRTLPCASPTRARWPRAAGSCDARACVPGPSGSARTPRWAVLWTAELIGPETGPA